MTITSLARDLNTTPMTIYRRLRKEGIEIKDLRGDGGKGDLSQYGVTVISALYDRSRSDGATDDCNSDATLPDHDTQHAVILAKLEAAEERCRMLEAERDRLLIQLQSVTDALQREQADRTLERQQLLTGSKESGKGFFRWLKR